MLLKRTPFRCSLSFGNRKKSDGIDLGYKVDVAAIPIAILSKFPLSPLQNALEHCNDEDDSSVKLSWALFSKFCP